MNNNINNGNSMSNHPIFLDVDTLTSQILLIFSLFVDNVEMINPWKFQPLTPNGSKVYWDFKIQPKWVFPGKTYHFEFTFSVITIVLIILSSLNLVWVSFFGVRNPKITLKRLKNKRVLRYLRFQVLGTCEWADAENVCGQIDNWKTIFSFSIDINLSLSQKWLLVIF